MDNDKGKQQNRITNKNFKLQVKYDFFKGTVAGWRQYIVSALLFIFICIIFKMEAGKILKITGIDTVQLGDYILFTFRGMGVFAGSAIELQDKLPQWFLINIYLSIIIGYFPLRDLNEAGIQVLIRTKSREQWWLSKCLWVIFSVVMYYAIGIIIIAIFAVFSGGIKLTLSGELNFILQGVQVSNITAEKLIFIGVLIPIVASITLSLIQLLISLYTNSIIGNMVIIVVLGLTPFISSPIYISNYLMILRSSSFVGNSGVQCTTAVIVCILFSVIIVIIGNYKVKKIDIFSKTY